MSLERIENLDLAEHTRELLQPVSALSSGRALG